MTDWKSQLRDRLSSLSTDPACEADIVDELAQHLADLEDAALRRGATPEEAYAATLAEVADDRALARAIRRADMSRFSSGQTRRSRRSRVPRSFRLLRHRRIPQIEP